MLSQYIKEENCHACQFCCRFRTDNLWDVPLFTDEQKINLKEEYPHIRFKKMGTLWTPMLITEEEYYDCPFLNHNTGCVLGKDKPFDCALWPFYIMRKQGKIVLTKCYDCTSINKISKDQLLFSLHTVLPQIKNYINVFPDYIKPYILGYDIFIHL